MCGIAGYIGHSDRAQEVVLFGLKTLEYRGYDSAGYVVVDNNKEEENTCSVKRSANYRRSVSDLINSKKTPSYAGIGHTRWATHGVVSTPNTHPIECQKKELFLAHNGTIENHEEIKALLPKSYKFYTETDSEAALAYLSFKIEGGLSVLEAMSKLYEVIEGSSSFLLLTAFKGRSSSLVALRKGSAGAIVVGKTKNETFLASDMAALAPYCDQAAFLKDGQICVATKDDLKFFESDLKEYVPDKLKLDYSTQNLSKGKHKHFMQKEILEQPEALRRAMYGRLDTATKTINLDEISALKEGFSLDGPDAIKEVVFVAMGTSLHAAHIASLQFESLVKIPSKALDASEFRYQGTPLTKNTLVVAVTQSGESADTLAAMDTAKKSKAKLIAVVENRGTQATQIADATLLTNAGLEQGVAATKTFSTQTIVLLQLVLYMAKERGVLEEKRFIQLIDELDLLPSKVEETISLSKGVKFIANDFVNTKNMLYLGRGLLYPVALEGALKMKEITYIHAEGISGGSMKHGTNALIDENTPAVALINQGVLRKKMLTNISEYEARKGRVYRVGCVGSGADISFAKSSSVCEPILAMIPLQILAYEVALLKGNDPDRPRNLAKTVTVE